MNSFLTEIADLNPVEIYEGPDFWFGKKERKILIIREHFSVNIIEQICCSTGMIISSSRIRNLILQGRLLQAGQLLGWTLSGVAGKPI